MAKGAHEPWAGYLGGNSMQHPTTYGATMPKSTPKRGTLSMIYEDEATGQTFVYRFPCVEGFEVGTKPLDDEDAPVWDKPLDAVAYAPQIFDLQIKGRVSPGPTGSTLIVNML